MTTVLIADDHEVVRTGLRTVLEQAGMRVVGETGDGLEVAPLAEELRPDLLVLDLQMPNLRGIEIAQQVRRRAPGTRLLFLSFFDNEAYVAAAFQAGAGAYLLKGAGNQDLLRGVQEVLAGRRYLSPPLSQRAVEAYLRRLSEAEDPYETLTEREREVLFLTIEGKKLQEIADRLFISPRTVETHRTRILRKLDLRSQAELVRFAYQRGLVPQPPAEG